MRALLAILFFLAAVSAASSARAQPSGPRRLPFEAPKVRRARWLPAVKKWAGTFGVPWLWLAAVVRMESNWNPNLVNDRSQRIRDKGNAWGLVQLIPKTAADLIAQGATPRGRLTHFPQTVAKWSADSRSLLDPHLNLMLGAYMMARNIARFGRNFNLITMAHQSGAGNVRAVLDAGRTPPDGLGPRAKQAAISYRRALVKEHAELPGGVVS